MNRSATKREPADIIGPLIEGQHVADAARTQPVFNPAIGEATREVAQGAGWGRFPY